MQNKIFFGIRTDLITDTQGALKRNAERKAEKEKPEKMAKKTAEEMAAEEASKKRDAEILAFLEAFKKQDYMLDLVIYTGVKRGVLHLETFLPLPAGVSYDVADLNFISTEKRAEIEKEMKKDTNAIFFNSKEEAIDYMTSN